jgi:hypothetical protein
LRFLLLIPTSDLRLLISGSGFEGGGDFLFDFEGFMTDIL